MNRRARWLWAAIVIALWIVLIACTYWEPVVRDAWGNVNWHRTNKVSFGTAWDLLESGWLGSNPRLGQTVTTLLYAPGPYHVVLTPLFEIALFYVMTTLALGRWPSVRRSDDALAFATVTAIAAICIPQFGPMLFYRPFTGNYTFGLLLNLVWLVPYRLHVAEPRAWRIWWAPLWLVLGVAAGMCNEHTGPTFIGAGIVATVWSLRRDDRSSPRLAPWMIAGILGLIAGYVLLLVAPGHDARYGGLAREAGMIERILDRGLVGNLQLIGFLVMYLAWSLPWIALGAYARKTSAPARLPAIQRACLVTLAAGGVLATLVLLASPKLGPRLYLASVSLIVLALAGWVLAQLNSSRTRIACAVLSGAVLAYVSVRCVLTYRIVGPHGEQRLSIIHTATPGSTVSVPRYPIDGNNWFIGEDFTAANLREAIAAAHGLARIDLAP